MLHPERHYTCPETLAERAFWRFILIVISLAIGAAFALNY